MDLSIIIVNYNVKEFLQNLLHSIKKATQSLQTEIIIIDNASDDGSVEFLREKFPEVKVIANNKNLGFGKANNLGLKIASGKYLLMLNPDTIVAEDTFTKMISFFENNPSVGLAGCKILNPDGTLQLACRRSFPGPWTSFCKVTGLSNLFPNSRLFAKYNLTYLDENQTYEVDAISGSFMMMRKEVYEKIGGFDEQFFMYGEDLDLAYRVQKEGYKVYYFHETQIIHYKGESTKRSSLDETKVFHNAMHLFVKKHLSSSLVVEFILRSAIGIRTLFSYLNKIKLIILAIVLDFVFFDLALFTAENLVKSNTKWAGFPDFSIPIIYTIPALLHILIAGFTGAYKRDSLSVFRNFISIFISLPILTSLTFFFKQYAFSRAVVLITYLIFFFASAIWRMIIKLAFDFGEQGKSFKKFRTIIVGLDETAIKIANKLKEKKTDLYSVIGFIGFSNKDVGQNIGEFKIIGTDKNISKVLKEHKINEVIFSSTDLSYNDMMAIVASCQDKNVDFKIIGGNLDFIVGKTSVTMLDDLPLIELNYNIAQPLFKFIKRVFDISFSLPALFLIYPLIYFKRKLSSKHSKFSNFVIQIPSVVSGKYSFVGPKTSSDKKEYFLGKKGLTGYWYIESGTESENEKLNLLYAKNQNIWLDLEILGRTFNKMWRK